MRLSLYDKLILELDRPDNPMVVVAAMFFAAGIDCETLETTLAARIATMPRLHYRLAPERAEGVARDETFEARRHIRRLLAPPNLPAFLSTLYSQGFDPAQPAWDMTILEGGADATVVLFRVHHAYGDGLGLESLLLPLADVEPAATARVATPENGEQNGDGARFSLRRLFDIVRNMVLINLRRMDRVTSLRARLTGVKRMAWTSALSVEDVRSRAHARGATINDLLIDSYATALREALRGRDDLAPADRVRASVTFSLRSRGAGETGGNKFGMTAVELPLGQPDPDARFADIKRQLDSNKTRAQGWAAYALALSLAMLPRFLQRPLITHSLSRFSINFTNVSGPAKVICVAGHELRDIIVLAPPVGESGLCVCALSYAGKLRVSAVCDAATLRDPEAFLRAVADSFGASAPTETSLVGASA